MGRTRVLIVASSLGTGGLERQAVEMATGLDAARFDVRLATLHAGGGLEAEAGKRLGARLVPLCETEQWRIGNVPGAAVRLIGLVRTFRPHVVYGLQPVVNELSLVAARLGGAKCVFGYRFSRVDWNDFSKGQAVAFRAGAVLSRFADALVANSYAGLRAAGQAGYDVGKGCVVANGIDTDRFVPDEAARAATRNDWSIPAAAPVVGQVGQIGPLKDYPMFLRAASLLSKRWPQARFVVVGGPQENIVALREQAQSLGIGHAVSFTGNVNRVEKIYPALNVMALCSSSEGFPNVVGEAMACGVPCAVTDSGDAARIVGDTGMVVPVGDHAAMADAWDRLLERKQENPAVRERVVRNFSRGRMLDQVADIMKRLARER